MNADLMQGEALGVALAMAATMGYDEMRLGLEEARQRALTAVRISALERSAAPRWERMLLPSRVEARCWEAFQNALEMRTDNFPGAVLAATYACSKAFRD